MFLTARIFGVFTYIVLLCLALLGVRYLPQRQTKYVIWGYLLVLCAVAYIYVPDVNKDITRLALYAQDYAQKSLNDFLDLLTTAKSGLFMLVYFRLFANCLMPVTCMIVFGSAFYILADTSKKLHVIRSIVMLALMWIMTNDFYVISISNIRSYVAVAFVTFCIYREIFQHKFNVLNIFLYLCAIEMHSMGIVLVAFRILVYLVSGGKITVWKIILVPIILATLILAFPIYQDFLIRSSDKFERYYTNGTYNYVWERIIFTIQTIVQGYILWKAYVYRLFKENPWNSCRLLVIASFVVLLICHVRVTFMQRWIIFSTILELPVLIRLLQLEHEKHRHQVKQFLIATCLITFAFVCSRGNLCSLKFWE